MKHISLLIIGVILIIFFEQTQAQTSEFKYQGLLWEISGNDLEKPSFLYGTMHVSRKIAFNLDDIFFESLQKADMVAVESMPDNWLDHLFEDGRVGYGNSMTGQSSGYGFSNKDFYSAAFQMNFPSKMDIARSMFGQYQLINGLLYRSEGKADFEEDTYLDMFIYQAGKRFNKPTYSLEDYKESRDLVEQAFKDARKKEVDKWLEDMIEKKNIRTFDILQDAYRDRNIGLIDSMNRALYSNNYMEHMLFKRNENMVDSMETLMRTGSLFAGVGAAHLPGDDGMIDMLRKRGYTLRPLYSGQTGKGKAIKSKFEEKSIEREYTTQTTEDGFITLDMPNKLYEMYSDGGSISISPDYDNGAYVTITRLYTYNLLRTPSEQLNEKDLEKILFEFIPGEILSKEVIEEPYPGFDIKNITKTGNHQRYKFFVTPLEIIIFKMDGKKDFTKKESDKIFPTIKFASEKTEKQTVTSHYEGFELETPNYTIVNNTKYRGKRFVQGYDTETKDFVFLVETNLNDINYIEEDSFELHYIMEQFCENMETELDSAAGEYVVKNNIPAYYSYTILDSIQNTKLNLSTQLIGERFYLLGYLGDKRNAKNYFDNVKITSFNEYEKKFEAQQDTNLFYMVHAPEKNPMADYGGAPFYRQKKDDKTHEGYSKSQVYGINSNEQVTIQFEKFHDWVVYDNIDSLWEQKKVHIEKLGFELTDESVYKEDSVYFYEGLATREKSRRAVKFKYIQKNGSLYLLKTLIHQGLPLSPFIDTFYQTFTPLDTAIGISPLANKSELFLNAIENQDSILLTSAKFIHFETEDFEAVKKLFLEKDFGEDWVFVKDELLDEICEMDYETVVPFLEKLYIDSYENSNYQVKILSTLIYEQKKSSYAKAMQLLEDDLPISDGGGAFLWRLTDSVELAMPFIPQLLELSSIADYKFDVQGVLGNLVKYQGLSPRKYKSLKKQFLNEGKIEIKRAIGKQKQTKNKSYYSYYGNYNENRNLNKYVDLLYPFRKETKVSEFIAKVNKLEDPSIQMNIIELQLLNKESVSRKIVQKLAEENNHRYKIYKLLKRYDALDLMADSLSSEVAIARGFLSKSDYYGEKVDTIYYLKSGQVEISGVSHEVYYFIEKAKVKENYYSDDKKEKISITAFTWQPGEEIAGDNYYYIESVMEEDETADEVIKELVKQLQLKDRKRIISDNNYYEDKF